MQACCPDLESRFSPEFFKALCDPNRIAIVTRLASACGEQTVSQVAKCCPVDISVVSRHLATLRDAGIVTSRKAGKQVLYAVRYDALVKTLRDLADAIDSCCPTPPTKESSDE
jgi:ArsR family transcriptional regulator, arsenate/arsenite/antimonite-responsive transcriptional repressor